MVTTLLKSTGSQKVVGSNPISSTNTKGQLDFLLYHTLIPSFEGRGIFSPKYQPHCASSKSLDKFKAQMTKWSKPLGFRAELLLDLKISHWDCHARDNSRLTGTGFLSAWWILFHIMC